MSDIEKMLRDVAADFGADISSVDLMTAADEIERLRAKGDKSTIKAHLLTKLSFSKPIAN